MDARMDEILSICGYFVRSEYVQLGPGPVPVVGNILKLFATIATQSESEIDSTWD